MSESSNHQQHPNTGPEADLFASDSAGYPTPPDSRDNDRSSVSTEIPLPDFNQDNMEHTTAEPSIETSWPASPGSTDAPVSQDPPESEKGARKPVYKISSAESDWSDFTLSPLDDPISEEDSGINWKTTWAVVREVGETVILTLIIFFLIQTVIRNFRVVGTSMVDNLHDGQYLIIDKLSYNQFVTEILGMGGPQRGDVVVFEPPNRPGEDYVKRIIALPGEQVEIKQGQVLINGALLAEPFQPRHGSYSMPPRVVPEGEVFVLGDNRNNSNDSHNWGTLPIENIVGRAWLSYWPPENWGTIPRDEPTEASTLKHLLNELVPSANANSE